MCFSFWEWLFLICFKVTCFPTYMHMAIIFASIQARHQGQNSPQWSSMRPGTRFTKSLWAHDWNLGKKICSNFDSDDPIRTQFCTCHDSSAFMTCAKLWPDMMNFFCTRATHIQWDLDHELINPSYNGFLMYICWLLADPPWTFHKRPQLNQNQTDACWLVSGWIIVAHPQTID